MLDDFHQGQFDEGCEKEEMEAAAQAFYDMMDSAQKPLHFAKCCTRQRTLLPSAMVIALGKAGKWALGKPFFQLCRVP